MADYDRSEFFSNGCSICLIRFKYGIENLSHLHNYVTSITQHSDIISNECFSISYYRFLLPNANTRRINRIYNESLSDDCFHHCFEDCAFEKISRESFVAGIGKRFIIEIEYSGAEAADMRNIHLMAECFNAKNILFQIRVFDSFSDGKYVPISSGLYQQIRTFLLLGNTNNSLYFYSKYTKNGLESSQWQRLYANNLIEERIAGEAKKLAYERVADDTNARSAFVGIGHIFPLIPITAEMCTVLMNSECQRAFGMDIIIEKYKSKARSFITNIEELIESDSCFEKLFFLATCAYLIDEKDSSLLEDEKLIIIHERCVDYAQGIMQAVENAYVHAVISKGNKRVGCAALSLRIRKKRDAKYIIDNDSKYINSAKYIIEVYVVDLLNDKSEFLGIVDRFIANAQRRFNNSSDEDKESWKEQCGTPEVWKSTQCISLSDMFNGGKEGCTYWRYLLLPTVIAYHYGLQIFNNVILANDGFLGVWSKGKYFANSEYYKNEINYSPWNGTTYKVYIPLHSETEINYTDIVADRNSIAELDRSPVVEPVFSFFEEALNRYELRKNLVLGGKNKCVQEIKKGILSTIKKGADPDTIYVVDCSSITKKYHYELIAKAFFLLMARKRTAIKNVALINIVNKDDVIKVFRQFALFYNREGKNKTMQDKSVYLVDVNADMEIAFGGMISEIATNFQDQLLIGGVGESTKNIIYYLGGNHINEKQ